MNTLVSTLRRGFNGLLRFSGRDPARRFWPYAGVVVIGTMALCMAVTAAIMAKMIARMDAMPPGASGPMFPDAPLFFAVVQLNVVVIIGLLAAAVTRRLHDRGLSGWWGLPPAVFAGVAMMLFPHLFESFDQGTATPASLNLFGLLFANNVLYMVSLILLIVLLTGASQPGENRFGPPAP